MSKIKLNHFFQEIQDSTKKRTISSNQFPLNDEKIDIQEQVLNHEFGDEILHFFLI